MDLIKNKENKKVFLAKVEDSLANVIRKYVNRIPTLAIDEVEIAKNGSPLYDETIAHRMGLISLKMDKSHNEKTEETLKLKTKDEGIVYAEQFKGNIEVAYPKTPITLLNKNQELEVVAHIKAGRGTDHSKFSPGMMFYRNVLEISMDKEEFDEIKELFPEYPGKEKGSKVTVIDNKEREIFDVCESIVEKKGKELESKETGEIVISVESFGQLNVDEIMKMSIDEIKKDLKAISKVVDKI